MRYANFKISKKCFLSRFLTICFMLSFRLSYYMFNFFIVQKVIIPGPKMYIISLYIWYATAYNVCYAIYVYIHFVTPLLWSRNCFNPLLQFYTGIFLVIDDSIVLNDLNTTYMSMPKNKIKRNMANPMMTHNLEMLQICTNI